MKKFRIKVNGKAYEVEVEEIDGGGAAIPKITAPTTPQTVVQPAAPAVSPEPKTVAPAPSGAEVVTAPMPGKIMSIKVAVGQQVKAGDLLLILEAMKMENEIFCGTGGTIKEIRVSEGAAVNPEDVLVVIA
ncbi:MAG: biotin/lipoyl-binding protein [Clostridia bacterium]|jgi:biotin carboxyl carrier protein|nr:biotin/lipoyl-binding protein [Clostridia bacterium]